jgi:uncharacterized protein YerC
MNKLGIDNLVVVAVDAVKVGQHIKQELADGFQPLRDIPAIAFADFGKLQNIADKADEALAEIRDLTPAELEAFEQRVALQTGLPNTGLVGKVRQSLRIGANAYRLVLNAKTLYFEVQELLRREAA